MNEDPLQLNALPDSLPLIQKHATAIISNKNRAFKKGDFVSCRIFTSEQSKNKTGISLKHEERNCIVFDILEDEEQAQIKYYWSDKFHDCSKKLTDINLMLELPCYDTDCKIVFKSGVTFEDIDIHMKRHEKENKKSI